MQARQQVRMISVSAVSACAATRLVKPGEFPAANAATPVKAVAFRNALLVSCNVYISLLLS